MKLSPLIILSIIATICCNYVHAQVPGISWQKTYGGIGDEFGSYVEQTRDSGYVFIGFNSFISGDITNNHGQIDVWVVKTNATGNIMWQKSYGGTNKDQCLCIRQTKDGGYITVGYTYSTDGDITNNHGSYDMWVIKLDSSGTMTWQKTFGGTSGDLANSVEQTVDSGYIIAGNSNSNNGDITINHGDYDAWVIKLNASGNMVWQKTYGGGGDDAFLAIHQTTGGGYIAVGSTSSTNGNVSGNHGYYDNWVVKLDDTGKITWSKCYGGSSEDRGWSIEHCDDGGYIVGGFTNSTDGDITSLHGDHDCWVLKLTNSGNIAWQKTIGGSKEEQVNHIMQTKDAGYIFSGYTFSNDGDVTFNGGNADAWVVKLTPSGSIAWQKTFGGDSLDKAVGIAQTFDGNYIIVGRTASNNSGDVGANHCGSIGTTDAWLVKLGGPLGISTPQTELIKGLIVFPIPAVDIVHVVNNNSTTQYLLIDESGKTVLSGVFLSGDNTLNIQHLSTGLYYLKADNQCAASIMINK